MNRDNVEKYYHYYTNLKQLRLVAENVPTRKGSVVCVAENVPNLLCPLPVLSVDPCWHLPHGSIDPSSHNWYIRRTYIPPSINQRARVSRGQH
jgi:hypothetical protein